jgi:glycolate oxidase FAD binding subunit
MTTASSSTFAGSAVERPTGLDQAAQVLRDTRGTVVFHGGGTKMRWGGSLVKAPNLVLETGGLHRLIAHNPADMTAAVEAGMPLRTLQDQLAESGQWLALDPPTESLGATVGGLLATGDSGPRRLRYGALRDLVIGATLVLADGTVARAGGQVIKNVAGYDLSKLVYGSLGTLALVAEVVVRVHPRPETSATVVVPASVSTAADTTRRLLAARLEPSAVDWMGDPRDAAGGRLAVRFEGSRAGVEAQTASLRDLLDTSRPGPPLVESDETAVWDEFAATRRAEPGQSIAFAGTLPSRLTSVAQALLSAAEGTDVQVWLASHCALGLHIARFAGPPRQQVAAFDRWRSAIVAMGGTVVLRDRPDEIDLTVDAVGPAPSAAKLLRALKARLDPEGRFAPGRLGSWVQAARETSPLR